MDSVAAINYLESLLGRTLRAHTTDGVSIGIPNRQRESKLSNLYQRMFLGEFKCTDNV
jgi:hypothetical protein